MGGFFSVMLTKQELCNVVSEDFKNAYDLNSTLLESYIVRSFSEEVLYYCQGLPYYQVGMVVDELKNKTFLEFFEELKNNNGVFEGSVIIRLKSIAMNLTGTIQQK